MEVNRILVSCLFILCTNNFVSSQNIQECKSLGEYCQNHWECCSNSCMSYLYRCVKNLQEDNQNKPQNLSASNYVGYVFAISNQSQPSKFSSVEELISSLFIPTSEPSPSYSVTESIANRIGEDTNQQQNETIVETSTIIQECLQIGRKCYRNSECCTDRCHGFLHQCVT